MAKYHSVTQGEHLSAIAAKYGFGNYLTIWNDPNNEELKEKRKNPHVVYPGDRVYIPDRQEKWQQCLSEQRHVFCVTTQPLVLRIVLHDFDNAPIAKAACELEVGGNKFLLRTNEKGLISEKIPRTAAEGRLSVPSLGIDIRIRIGDLDPAMEDSGWRARLVNLGYYSGSVNDDDVEQFRNAHRGVSVRPQAEGHRDSGWHHKT
jgi:N-acetylmuramoyl-L-alanine amidase